MLNLTATDPTGPDSFFTVYPAPELAPLASNLNPRVDQTVANLVVARIGAEPTPEERKGLRSGPSSPPRTATLTASCRSGQAPTTFPADTPVPLLRWLIVVVIDRWTAELEEFFTVGAE